VPLFDLDAEALTRYRPEVAEPAGFDDFWAETLAQARQHDLAVRAEPVDAALVLVDVLDVTFAGWGGHPVRAWLTLPAGADAPLPAVVEYLGYGGGRGLPHERLAWAAAGFAHLLMDTRGQGSVWGTGGSTPDPVGSGPAAPGFMTRGALDPREHYYRRLFTDAVRAVEAARALPQVDAGRVAVTGTSQGGGMALAVAGLVPDLLAVLPDVPFLSHIRRGVEMSPNDPYGEVRRYLAVHRDHVEPVFATLAHFDGVSFARRASAPTLFSVALMDPTCPPSTVYASYNAYGERAGGVAKEIAVYPFNEHEGGQAVQLDRQLRWLRARL